MPLCPTRWGRDTDVSGTALSTVLAVTPSEGDRQQGVYVYLPASYPRPLNDRTPQPACLHRPATRR